jgi:hypothetical protein
MDNRTYIQKAFEDDFLIYDFFDPNVNVSSIDEIVENIHTKILEYEDLFECVFEGLDDGYFFYTKEPKLLVSFGVNINSRNKERLSEFWDLICKSIGDDFNCFLWYKNSRGIKWLQKMGMKIEDTIAIENNFITRLKYSICH